MAKKHHLVSWAWKFALAVLGIFLFVVAFVSDYGGLEWRKMRYGTDLSTDLRMWIRDGRDTNTVLGLFKESGSKSCFLQTNVTYFGTNYQCFVATRIDDFPGVYVGTTNAEVFWLGEDGPILGFGTSRY